ncbi:GGDEF domain-containing protein [Neptunomonas antarctica]|uniref:diguanylate cyclase n=1 Tax=Neptunomonas antarctica TaxID=619304 RepID=A0A1N7KAJ2_9GAMM|nr:GGDEF domain-containing protein [Neptunomonas antarctica]SIS58573.1 diguanylate cyclase (GGDEF) domain-containing protein [Neptunomonas antarctica]
MKRSVSDFLIAIGVFLVSYLVAAILALNEYWLTWTAGYSYLGVDELPVALSFFSLMLAWYAWRRWQEASISHQQLSETIEQLRIEVEERKLAVEHAHVLSATKNEILENEYLRSKKLEQVRLMGDCLAAATSLKELQEISVTYLKNIILDHTVSVLFADKAFKNWTLVGAWGVHEDKVYTQVSLKDCQVLRQSKAYIESSNTQSMLCGNANLTSIKSVACYPIACHEMQFGVLHIRSEKLTESLLSSEDEEMIVAVCNTIGLHFYNAQLRAELSLASNRDELTGLLNRRGLGNTLKREIKASELQGYEVTVAMIDIDHFKKYNDSFGHQEGDKALRFVAETLAQNMRARDVVARYGGEEFILVLPNTSKIEAYKKLKMVIAKVAEDSHNSPDCKRVITLSVGIATCPQDHENEEMLIKSADLALYAAKKRGRNCVIAYKAPSPVKHDPAKSHPVKKSPAENSSAKTIPTRQVE